MVCGVCVLFYIAISSELLKASLREEAERFLWLKRKQNPQVWNGWNLQDSQGSYCKVSEAMSSCWKRLTNRAVKRGLFWPPELPKNRRPGFLCCSCLWVIPDSVSNPSPNSCKPKLVCVCMCGHMYMYAHAEEYRKENTCGGITPPHMTRISGRPRALSSLMSSGTRVLWPAASVLTPTAWTSASTACCATSRGVWAQKEERDLVIIT